MRFKTLYATVLLGISASALAAPPQPTPLCAEPSGGVHGCLYTSIQDAIDAATSPGATVDVYPGQYDETASGRTVAVLGGPHQFGLFIGQDRSGITVQGVDAKGRPINDYRKVQAFITTNATNNFGYSGIFVEGDGVTISGLGIGRNIPGQNKTIEVIGDDFALADCNISDTQGSVYINDFRFDTVNNVSHVQSYDIEDNNFQDGVSIDIGNGAGFSGPVQNRVIKYNNFANSSSQPSISFNGSDTGVPWFVQSVGGAVIQDNTFVNIFTWTTGDDPSLLLTEGHIHARGTYNDSQFDWNTYFNFNKFDRAYATGPQPPTNLREYTYDGSYGTIQHVRRIGALLAGEQAIAQPGDKTVP